MADSSLVGQVVKADEAGLGAIAFMFPSFIQSDEIFFDKDLSMIYTGPYSPDIRNDLFHMVKQYIIISGTGRVDVDFTDRSVILNTLYEKWGKTPNEETLKVLESLPDDDFWHYFKQFWVLGSSKIDSSPVSMFELYRVLGKSKFDILKIYFQLRECFPDSYIFSGLLSFLDKVLNPDKVSSQSGRYLNLIDGFRKSFGNKSRGVVYQAYTMCGSEAEDKEFRTLWTLMQLGGGSEI